jgi:hypothetical protein
VLVNEVPMELSSSERQVLLWLTEPQRIRSGGLRRELYEATGINKPRAVCDGIRKKIPGADRLLATNAGDAADVPYSWRTDGDALALPRGKARRGEPRTNAMDARDATTRGQPGNDVSGLSRDR